MLLDVILDGLLNRLLGDRDCVCIFHLPKDMSQHRLKLGHKLDVILFLKQPRCQLFANQIKVLGALIDPGLGNELENIHNVLAVRSTDSLLEIVNSVEPLLILELFNQLQRLLDELV